MTNISIAAGKTQTLNRRGDGNNEKCDWLVEMMTDRSQSRLSHQQPPHRLRLGGPHASDWSLCFGTLTLFYKKSNILGHGSTHQAPSCGQIYWVGFVFPSSSKETMGSSLDLREQGGQEPLGKSLPVCSARLQVLCLTLENTTATHNPSLTDRLTKQRQEHKNGGPVL